MPSVDPNRTTKPDHPEVPRHHLAEIAYAETVVAVVRGVRSRRATEPPTQIAASLAHEGELLERLARSYLAVQAYDQAHVAWVAAATAYLGAGLGALAERARGLAAQIQREGLVPRAAAPRVEPTSTAPLRQRPPPPPPEAMWRFAERGPDDPPIDPRPLRPRAPTLVRGITWSDDEARTTPYGSTADARQMSSAYSRIARSDENLPTRATFSTARRVHRSGSR